MKKDLQAVGRGWSHQDLVSKAAKWSASQGCVVVTTEVGSWYNREIPDALGWKVSPSVWSTTIECKVSRSDFLVDAKKWGRTAKKSVGRERWYLTPPGLLDPQEVPDGWGLLEISGRGLEVRRYASTWAFKDVIDYESELAILLSVCRRLGRVCPEGVSVKAYTIPTKNTATVGVLSTEDNGSKVPYGPLV